jgi:hypothetical protein
MDPERGAGDEAQPADQDRGQADSGPGQAIQAHHPSVGENGERATGPTATTVPDLALSLAPDDTAQAGAASGGISKWDGAEQPKGAPLGATRAQRTHGPGRHLRRWTAAILLVGLLALAASGAVSAYMQYSHVRAEAADGVAHLKHVQALLAPLQQRPAIPDADTMRAVASDLTAAEHDFALTRRDLGRGVFSLAAGVPAGASTLDPVAMLAAAADEACLAGLDLVRGVSPLIPLLHSDLLAGGAPTDGSAAPNAPSSQPPALTAAMVQQLTADFEDAIAHLGAAISYARHADLSALPQGLITAQQMAQLHSLLAQWPRIAPQLVTVDAWLRVAPSLLGLSGPMRLLVELMDRGEMRSTGGYIGDYGVMTIQDGKLQPFTLTDVLSLDFPYAARNGWPLAPPAYRWWPWVAFGLRDSNLSPDFPTSAQMGIKLLAAEGGPDVQGVVALNVVTIARVLAIVGPVSMPEYNQVVTAENLEMMIRQYTENDAIRSTSAHEQFTAVLGRAFMSKLHGLPANQLIAIAQAMLTSLRAKDLEVYFSDTATGALLTQQGFDSTLTRGPGDGLTIIDSHESGNKASAVTTVSYTDAVALDANGTATHHLTIAYRFDSATNPAIRPYLYGLDYYGIYLRVYTPPNAQLASLEGLKWSYNQIGVSDEPGRQMWGGYVFLSDGVPYSLHFVWSVPDAATEDDAGHWSYHLTIQHQSGSNQQLNLTVTMPGAAAPVVSYTGALDQDRAFSVALPFAGRNPR